MAELPPFFLKDMSAGMITGVNENIQPRNSVALGLNVNFDDELGSAVSRLGTFIVGGQMVDGKEVLGLHNYTTNSTSELFATLNDSDDASSVIYDAATGEVEQTSISPNRKMRFLTYLGSMLAINGADAERAYNGTSWITSGGVFDLANIPGSNLNSICTEFLDRVYLAGDTANPDRVYYSSLPSSGAVTWGISDPDDGSGYVDVEAEDGGGGLTAFGKVPGYILFFKKRTMHRWNFSSAFPESLVNIGTPTQECVISQAGICAFFSASSRDTKGFYVTNGGRPVPISHLRTKNIYKWVKAIPASSFADIAGGGTENHFYWSVGDLTVDGETYQNVVFRWSTKTGEWAVRTYPTRFTCFSSYEDPEGNNVLVAGDDDGNVIELERPETYTDYVTIDGEPGISPINFDIRTYQEKFKFNQKKTIDDRIVINTRGGQGAVPYIRIDGGESVALPSVEKDVHEAKIPINPTGNYFEFGLRGTVQGQPMVLKEIEVPKITIHQNYDS